MVPWLMFPLMYSNLRPWKSEAPFPALAIDAAQRLRNVENALLGLYFDGQAASAATHERLEQYVRGELSWEEAFAEFYGVEGADQEAEQWAQQAATGPKTYSRWQD